MTKKQPAILVVLSLSVIRVFCDLAFRLVGDAVPSLQTPTLQFEQATRIPEVATEAPDAPPILNEPPAPLDAPALIDPLEPKKPEELTPPAPRPEELRPHTPLPEEEQLQ